MVDRLLLHPLRFRGSQHLVQFVELRGRDVLLFVDAQNFVLFLIAHQFLLRGFHFHLQVDELLGQPVGSLHRGFESGLEIVLLIGLHQRVHHILGSLRVRATEMDFHDAGVGEEGDLEISFEGRQQRRGSRRICLQRIGSQIQRRGKRRRFPSEIRPLIEVQFLNDLQRQEIALQNLNFRFHFRGIVIVKTDGV